MRLMRTSTSSMPSPGISRDAPRAYPARAARGPSSDARDRSPPARRLPLRKPLTSTDQSAERTISSRSVPETMSRATESMMSSSRARAPGSSRTERRNCSGSAMRQRAVVSTTMNSRPSVGIWLTSPSQASSRLSNRRTSWMNGTRQCRPGSSTTSPIGSPNCTMMPCSAWSMTNAELTSDEQQCRGYDPQSEIVVRWLIAVLLSLNAPQLCPLPDSAAAAPGLPA
jgi:hypothetical protein